MPGNIWTDWPNESPELGWELFRPQTPNYNQTNYWKDRQGDVWSRYVADTWRRVTQNQPNLAWTDYLKNFSFQGEWNALAPWKRGERYQPGIARWNNPF